MSTISKQEQKRLRGDDFGKPMPPTSRAEHGGRGLYQYGCRCDLCRQAESEYRRRKYQEKKAAEGTG